MVVCPETFRTCAKNMSKPPPTTTSQAMEDDDALHDRYQGIDPFDGIDVDGLKWHTFKDQLKAATDVGSTRTRMIVYGKQAKVTAANAAVEAGIMFNDLQGRDPTAYDKLWGKDYCWEPGYVQNSVNVAKKAVFKWYTVVFEGRCLTKVKALGWENVGDVFGEFDREYGKLTVKDLHDHELKFEKGIVKPDGQKMCEHDDMVDMLSLWCQSQADLALEVPEGARAANSYLTEEKMVEVICNSVHPSYAETISNLRFQTWMKAVSQMTTAQATAEHAKGFEAYREYKISLTDLKGVLTAKYRAQKNLWAEERKSKAHGKVARILAYGGPKIAPGACWDCGSLDHRRGDDSCPCKGQLKFAPQWLLDKIAAKSSGGGDGKSSAPTKKVKPTCRYWKRNGQCRNGKHCAFPHPPSEKGVGKNEKSNARLSKGETAKQQSRMDKFTNQITAALVSGISGKKTKRVAFKGHEEPEEDASSDSENPAKVMRSLVMKAVKSNNIFMIRGDVSDGYKQEVDIEQSKIDPYGITVLDYPMLANQASAHSPGVVAFDNCAKISASNMRSDFLKLDESEEAKRSARIVGVGGEAKCGGRGVMMLTLKHSHHGTWVMIDPDAIYLESNDGKDPPLRCVSANRMEDFGLYIHKTVVDGHVTSVLRDTRTDLTLPLDREDGLCVLRTVERDLRNHRKDRNVYKVVGFITAGKHCPIFKVQDLTTTLATAKYAMPFCQNDTYIGNTFTKPDQTLDLSSPNTHSHLPIRGNFDGMSAGDRVEGRGKGGFRKGKGAGSGAGRGVGQEYGHRSNRDRGKGRGKGHAKGRGAGRSLKIASQASRGAGKGSGSNFPPHSFRSPESGRPIMVPRVHSKGKHRHSSTGGLSLKQQDPRQVQAMYDSVVGGSSSSYDPGYYDSSCGANLPGPDVGRRIDYARQIVGGDRLFSPTPVSAAMMSNTSTARRPTPAETYEAGFEDGWLQRQYKQRKGPSMTSVVTNVYNKSRQSKRKPKPSMKQKQLKDSVGKRTAKQPPPNCKTTRHLRFDDDDDDYQPPKRVRAMYRRPVSGSIRITKTADFSCGVSTERSGTCETSDGASSNVTRESDVDTNLLCKVMTVWVDEQHFELKSGEIEKFEFESEQQVFASLLSCKVELDTNHHYSNTLLHQLEKYNSTCKVFVLNTAALSKKQRSVLWHYRLGHVAEDIPLRLARRNEQGIPFAYGIDNCTKLNCDCAICDKSRFKVKPFKSVPAIHSQQYPPFFCIQVDGFGGQGSLKTKAVGVDDDTAGVDFDDSGAGDDAESFQCQSIGGAVGGYNFVDVGTGAITPRLYSKKSQFPAILKRFILEVTAMQWQIRIIRASDSEIVNNGEVEAICAEWDILIQPTSQGTPAELGRVEVANRDIAKMARGMLMSAPHLPPSMWGAAFVYAGVISWLLPKKWNEDMTPYEAIRGRAPDLKSLCIHVFGCPTEVRRVPTGDKYKTKLEPRTETMYFVGTDYPSVLVWLPSKNRIYRVSKRKVSCHEGAYVAEQPLTALQLKQRIVLDDEQAGDSELSVVDTVPTVRSLRILNDQVDPGEKADTLERYLESNESIDAEEDSKFQEKLLRMFKKALLEPSLQQQLVEYVQQGHLKVTPNSNDGLNRKAELDQGSSNRTTTAGTSQVAEGKSKARRSKRAKPASKETEVELQSEAAQAKEVIQKHKQGLPPLNRAKPGTRVKILTKLFDPVDEPGKYSKGRPKVTYGTIRGHSARGVVRVLWDDENRQIGSHWKDIAYLPAEEDPHAQTKVPMLLQSVSDATTMRRNDYYWQSIAKSLGLSEWEEPYRSLATVEILTVQAILKAAGKVQRPKEWPRTFMECLLSPDWRKWLEAVLKEYRGWQEFDAAEEVPRSSRDPDHALVRIGELYTRKRDNSCKFRPYCMGNLLVPQKHYYETFSGTVTADTIRFFFSLATAMGKTVWQADAKCAYLQSEEQSIPIYCLKPTFWDFVHMPIEQLMEVRKQLMKVHEEHGITAVRKLGRTMINNDNIILLKKPLYGIPSAGFEWAQTLIRHLTGPALQFKRSQVDGCCYYKTRGNLEIESGPYEGNMYRAKGSMPQGGRVDGKLVPHRRDAVWTSEYILMLTWTDDFPYFGTDAMVAEFNRVLPTLIKVDLIGECEDFISIEVTQHDDGSKELTHSKYWLALKVKYATFLGDRKMKVPMKPGVDKLLVEMEITAEEHEAVANFPYRELVGSISFPSCHTKLEIRFAVSIVSRHLHDWNAACINAALDLLSYCVETHDIGVLWTPEIDPHGANVPYGYADAGYQAPRSQGGRLIKMNSAVVSLASQCHSTVDTSTTAAEMKEAFLLSNDICGMRNLMEELGLPLPGPTLIYEDNLPCLQVVEGNRNMSSTTRHLEIAMWKLRERSDMQLIEMVFCRTYDQLADAQSKALGTELFRYLRDCMNGYAAALLANPERDMPVQCITMAELSKMLKTLANADAQKEAKKAEQAAKKRKK